MAIKSECAVLRIDQPDLIHAGIVQARIAGAHIALGQRVPGACGVACLGCYFDLLFKRKNAAHQRPHMVEGQPFSPAHLQPSLRVLAARLPHARATVKQRHQVEADTASEGIHESRIAGTIQAQR